MSPSRGWLFLCLVARVSAICSEAPDAGQVRVKAVNTDCPAIYAPVPKPGEETCLRGRNPGSMLSGRFEQITVRAVSYVPRPIGVASGTKDVYTSALRHIHQRDLYLIAKVLKANAVKLEPWDDEADHSEFLRLCREYGLFVIPTFDLKYFFQDKWLKRNSLEREKEMLKHWDELLRSVYNTDPILAWTVNYALLLNETISQIPKESWKQKDPTGRREIYFDMITKLRQGHFRREWQEDDKAFRRPLLLPLDMDSRVSETDVAWYTAFAETYWGTWPKDSKDAAEQKKLSPFGAFDGWIAITKPESTLSGVEQTKHQVKVLQRQIGDDSAPASSGQLGFPYCLQEKNGQGCTYRSKKLAILQYGFAALQQLKISSKGYLKMEVDSNFQQKAVTDVWTWASTVSASDKKIPCNVVGTVVDEWVDDWDRCAAERGLRSNPFSQNIGGICDDVAHDKRRHLEWFGLNAQYDAFGTHCVDPRFLSFGGDRLVFRFEEKPGLTPADRQKELDDLLKDPEFPGFCHRLLPGYVQVFLWIFGCCLLVVIWLYRTWKICFAREKLNNQQQGQVEMESLEGAHAASPAAQPSVADRLRRARRTVVEKEGQLMPPALQDSATGSMTPSEATTTSEESRSRVPVFTVSHRMQVPQRLGGPAASSKDSAGPTATVMLEVLAARHRGMGQEQALFHLQAHHSAQYRRLWHQVESEALCLQARGFPDTQCYGLAMHNVHARAMEGYLVWLQSRREPTRDREGNEKLETLLGQAGSRNPWELWVEALLLRLLESLSEQGLHAPEYVAAVYDQIRWGEVDEVKLPLNSSFLIKYDDVLRGVEAIRKNGDPFRGGVNFDDVNELGLEGSLDQMSKTYREASSMWVVLDLLSNFQPVLIVKAWIFVLAWYCFLSEDSRNGYIWYPTFKRANALQYIAMCDCSAAAVLEILNLFHGLGQRRLRSFCAACVGKGGRVQKNLVRWLIRRLFTLVVATCGAVTVFTYRHIEDIDLNKTTEDIKELTHGYSEEQRQALTAAALVILVRFIAFALVTRPYAIPFIDGRPQKKPSATTPQALRPLNASAPLLRSAMNSQMSGARRSMERDAEEPGAAVQDQDSAGLKQEEVRLLREFAWIVMLLACFLFEMRFIVPLIADFEFDAFCGDTCALRRTKYFTFVSSDCYSCIGGLGLVWSLVILTAFFDIYYIFYAGTAVFGYGMGEWRGLRNVLSTALRHLDLDSGTTGRVPEVATPRRHAHRIRLTDGEAMQQVFGVSWRMVWSRIVEALYEDCVISSNQANAMVKAGSTVRWDSKENLQTSASPQDQFSRLRFVATQLRNGSSLKDVATSGARHRCLSALEVHVRPPGSRDAKTETRLLQNIEDFTVDCKLETEDLRRALVTALKEDKGMQSIIPFSVFELSPGSRLIAVNDSWPVLKDEMIEELSNAALPALLVFQRAGTSFHEVEVELQPPARVKSMSFMTGKDVPGLDPVCWKVEGFVADKKGGGRWKQLVWQDKPYAPPFKRETDLCVVFDVEHWRVDTSKVASITLQSFLPVVQERLSFFTASLRSLLRSSEKYGIRAGIDTLLDSHIGNIPSLTQVIPCYNETVILSKQYLQEDDGLNSNLAFIISQFPEEWAFFCERHDSTPKGMHDAFMGRGDHMLTPAVIMEVRMWASMRSQTVARTVVGAMQYQEVVAMLPSVQSAENPGKALESCVELVLAHQTYGSKAGTPANDESVRYLLAKYRHLCFFLVFDFDADKSRPDIVTAVNNFVREKYRFDRPVRHASVLARFRKGAYKEDDFEVPESAVEILEVLPRCFALLVGTPGFMTQGKAGNQLGALRFSRGHFLQMMDANMGAFLGEATKVPFILRRFQPHWTDRTTVRARIIGFREFIFTESHGAVGSVMASAEWSFGTICQRFLAGLGARMHYGHPDFLDGFWASNRGSLSKASPAINLSEDIFAGFNVRMRGEASKHVDALAWEKGRESSFNAAALFYTKVSKGNVGVMRSRDLKVITQNLNIVDNFSFYFASVGFYLNNLLIDASATVYVLLFILLALSSKSLVDVASLDSMLATEWTLSMGTIAMFPRFMELTLEYGPLEGILRFVPSIPGCMTMFTFINKSIASGVQETMVTGEASYIATGRPNANTHYSWKECYFIHCSSHYYPALRIFIGYSIYVLVSQAQGFSTLPMMVLLASAVMWLIAPILFCPQPTLASLGHDLSEFWQFAIAAPDWSVRTLSQQLGSKDTEEHLRTGLRDPRSTLYEFWLLKALEHKKFSCFQRVGFLLLEILCVVFLLSVVYSSLLDDIWLVILLYSIHYLLMEIWRLLYRPTVLTLLTTVMWLLVPIIIQMPLLNSFFLLLILVVTLQAVRSLVLLLVWGVLRPNLDWKKMPENSESERAAKQATARRVLQYDIAVEYLYVNLMGHQLHLYAAFAILLMNFAVQFVLVLLELLYGLHSWALLNPRLRSRRCCQTRRGYEPS